MFYGLKVGPHLQCSRFMLVGTFVFLAMFFVCFEKNWRESGGRYNETD